MSSMYWQDELQHASDAAADGAFTVHTNQFGAVAEDFVVTAGTLAGRTFSGAMGNIGDQADVSWHATPVGVWARGTTSDTTIFGGAGDDILIGGHDPRANWNRNVLVGEAGNDILIGGFAGSNILSGGAGHNVLQGSSSAQDLLVIGAGHDLVLGFTGRQDQLMIESGQPYSLSAATYDAMAWDPASQTMTTHSIASTAITMSDGSSALVVGASLGDVTRALDPMIACSGYPPR